MSYEEASALAQLRFDWRDRQEPLSAAKGAAYSLHYYQPEELLCGPALLQQFDQAALDRFLSLLTLDNMNLFWSGRQFVGCTNRKERWYGAEYAVKPLADSIVQRVQQYLDLDVIMKGVSQPELQPPCGQQGVADSYNDHGHTTTSVVSAAARVANGHTADVSARHDNSHLASNKLVSSSSSDGNRQAAESNSDDVAGTGVAGVSNHHIIRDRSISHPGIYNRSGVPQASCSVVVQPSCADEDAADAHMDVAGKEVTGRPDDSSGYCLSVGELHLPAHNWALPSDLSLRVQPNSCTDWRSPPQKLLECAGLCAWHRADTSFSLPKVRHQDGK